MMTSRRSILSAIAFGLPFGLGARLRACAPPLAAVPTLRFRLFEEEVRAAFADNGPLSKAAGQTVLCRRVEIGHCEQVQTGIQGCHNDRPFAGFPAGYLRIVRTGSEPGPVRQGVRLYVSTADVALTGGLTPGIPSRPLNFASLPPAPAFS
jgi:hypothetical protein